MASVERSVAAGELGCSGSWRGLTVISSSIATISPDDDPPFSEVAGGRGVLEAEALGLGDSGVIATVAGEPVADRYGGHRIIGDHPVKRRL